MSITSDIRNYADSALEQGKHALDQAQAQLNDVTGDVTTRVNKLADTAKDNVSGISTKASAVAGDLRTQAEKVLPLDAIKSAVEPYLAHAREYATGVSDRATGVYRSLTSDKRVAKVVDSAEAVVGSVTEVVQERVVKPVISLTGLNKSSANGDPQAGRQAGRHAARAEAGHQAGRQVDRSQGAGEEGHHQGVSTPIPAANRAHVSAAVTSIDLPRPALAGRGSAVRG